MSLTAVFHIGTLASSHSSLEGGHILPVFTRENTEAQKSDMACPRSPATLPCRPLQGFLLPAMALGWQGRKGSLWTRYQNNSIAVTPGEIVSPGGHQVLWQNYHPMQEPCRITLVIQATSELFHRRSLPWLLSSTRTSLCTRERTRVPRVATGM